MNKNGNIILNSIKESEQSVDYQRKIPAGYIEVKLSTKGKIGAPEVVHVRNFKVSEILALSLTEKKDLPIRLIDILNDAIFEDVDVANWHEKEVEELMIYIYMTFFKPVLSDIPYPLSEKDYEIIGNQPDGEEKIKALNEGKWIPKTSINISQSVDTYTLEEDFSPNITITSKKTGFHVTFGFIKYGDQLKIRKWIDTFFAEKESSFEKIKKQLEYNQGIEIQLKDNPSALNKLIPINKEEEEAYNNYILEKARVVTDTAYIISIIDFNGQDISNLTIGEKYELLCNDARIDYNLISALGKKQKKLQFGIKPEVSMKNPITGEIEKKMLSFRIPFIIQSMRVSTTNEYDDECDDETFDTL